VESDLDGRGDAPTLAALAGLVEDGSARDRAFADAIIRMRWPRARASADREAAELEQLHRRLRPAANRAHTQLRAAIASGACVGDELQHHFDAQPLLERDHVVEEVLGIAYPPLEQVELDRDLMAFTPSCYDEIRHAFDATGLGAGDRFLDIGSGTGKAVLLASLLRGATSTGIECDRGLHDVAGASARELRIASTDLIHGDARETPLGDADVLFMYVPFTGKVMTAVMDRIAAQQRPPRSGGRRRFLCAAALDLERYKELTPVATPMSWLNVYAWG